MKTVGNANKILILGVDGMDPRLTKKYVAEGIMPNTKKYIEQGAQREDLVMLGGHPTVTPPMWTTLATGAYANVHGITGFYRKGSNIDKIAYNVDSRLCKAEQLWNVFAEAGKKTLVWHWPGSAWPPSSTSENLMVVDGVAPGAVNMTVACVDVEHLVGASEEIPAITYKQAAASDASAACVINDLDVEKEENASAEMQKNAADTTGKDLMFTIIDKKQQTTEWTEKGMDLAQSPIKPASGWISAPEDAKEFVVLFSNGLIRRPALILKNENGIYDRVALYKSKKETEPIAVCYVGRIVPEVVDEAFAGDVKYEKVNRNILLIKLAEDGSSLSMHISPGMDMTNDSVWHPKRLFKEVTENVGYPSPASIGGAQNEILINECMLQNWYVNAKWQAESILYLIEQENIDVVFSHFHTIDIQEHMFIKHLAKRPFNRQPVEVVEGWMKDLYRQCDYYLGKFLPLLDQGWTIFIVSDHGQVASAHEIPLLVDMNGIVTPIMEELGYTVLKRDEYGNRTKEIDFSKTRAVMQREGHLYINLKGRDPYGIVDPKDKYELEERIMTDLYSLRSKETGHRIVSVALRNRDAVLLGQGGSEAGDICVWMAEGYNFDHADSLSTAYGENDTSVSPIFIAAGKGLKHGYKTDRIIREVDLVPTVAILGGVRMPAQCEGAPVYQILEED